MTDPVPRIDLDWGLHWCPIHLEPFREAWPEGAVVGMVTLAQFAIADEAIAQHTGGNVFALPAVLEEFAPICCHVDPGDMSQLYAEAGIDPARALERTKTWKKPRSFRRKR